MTTQIKRRRGTTTEHSTFTGAEAELTIDTTKDTVVVHDGSTAGGHPLAKESSLALKVDKAGDTMTGDLTVPNLIVSGNVDGRDVSADGTKLDGIEAGADVTDTANVSAAGAAMETGAAFTGNVTFGDNDKAIFGAGSDLQIFHDGSNSRILEAGTGFLAIGTNGTEISLRGDNFNDFMLKAEQNSAVTLYHNAVAKLATTSTGIDVTGTVTSDGLTSNLVGGSQGTFYGWSVLGNNSASGAIELGQYSAFQGVISYAADSSTRFLFDNTYGSTGSTFEFRTNTSATPKTHMKITGGGDISFYEDTGTTPKFFWDASAEELLLGSRSGFSAGNAPLVIADSSTNPTISLRGPNAGAANIYFGDTTDWTQGAISYDFSTDAMRFYTSNVNERMRIDSSGDLMVGTTSEVQADSSGTGLYYDVSKGTLQLKASGNIPIVGNRVGSDGAIMQFRRDGTTVGSIGTANGYIEMGSSDTGLRFYTPSDAIIPANPSTNSARDAAIDLGISSQRFKDLYLSGGVFLGGTGAANKLDDYEEGTWSPSIVGAISGSFESTNLGRYTKVGRSVHVQMTFNNLATNLVSGNLSITGLPFITDATNSVDMYHALQVYNLNWPSTAKSLYAFQSSANSASLELFYSKDAVNSVALAGVDLNGTYFRLSFTYNTPS